MENLEELIIRIGQLMDEKLQTAFKNFEVNLDQKLDTMLDEKLDKMLDKKLDKMLDQKLDKILDEKLDKKLDEKLNPRFEQFERKMDIKFDSKFEEIEKNLNSRLFAFEQEYGTKINTIYDAVILEQEKNIEKSDKIRKLDERIERVEADVFVHEKRISNLEINQ